MNLTIDIGNTCTKIILFDDQQPIYEEKVSEDLMGSITKIFSIYHPQRCAWCSVGEKDLTLEEQLNALPCQVVHLTGETAVPINVCYQSKKTLGADRLAAVLGATALYPKTDLLIVDAGTCITYDWVDAMGNYLGGNISPGIEMRLKALHEFTARLPKVEAEGSLPPIGTNTETAIRCGVIQGVTYEIEGYVHEKLKQHPHMKIFMTGGSFKNFTPSFQQSMATDAYLVARGLNRLLQQ